MSAYNGSMDTIICLYVNKQEKTEGDTIGVPIGTPCRVERRLEEDYCLLRVGIDRTLLNAIQREWERKEATPKQDITPANGIFFWRRMRAVRLARQQERVQAEQRRYVTELIESISSFLRPFIEQQERCRCVYEGTVGVLRYNPLWQQHWGIAEFQEGLEDKWVGHQLARVDATRLVVMGFHTCLPQWLCQYARNLKGLTLIVEQRLYTQQTEDFLEDFYEEYGIAPGVTIVTGAGDYHKVRFFNDERVDILDFTEEERMPMPEVGEGSRWFDMSCMEEKERRMEARKSKAAYFSMKKEWKQPQKAPHHLDTISKNGYNT